MLKLTNAGNGGVNFSHMEVIKGHNGKESTINFTSIRGGGEVSVHLNYEQARKLANELLRVVDSLPKPKEVPVPTVTGAID